MRDKVSRSEFALIIRAAAEAHSRRSGEYAIPLDEAERIAAEAGISAAEFRSAVQAVRTNRMGTRRFLGPSGVMTVEETVPRAVSGEEACQLLAEGQLSMALAGAAVHQDGEHVWRLGKRNQGELQVSTHGGRTRMAAIADSRKVKAALLAGSTAAGGIAGSVVLTGISFVAIGTPEALAISNLLGIAGGSALGFVGGRAAWTRFARRSQVRMYSAIERMRALTSTLTSAEPDTE
jgi:hypothetical protein